MFWSSAGQRGSAAGLLRCWSLALSSRTVLTSPWCPLGHTFRLFSVSSSRTSAPHGGVKLPLRQWALAVSPFTTVRAQLGCSSISISPLDPHTYPEADRAFITVHGGESEQGFGLDHLQVHYDEQSKELIICAEKVNSNVSIEVAAPIKSSECLLD